MRKLDDLKERRKYMLEMCVALHEFCLKEGIKYSLAYGTLIGAYRHKGFIPWDDDFDIMMTREDFDKLQKKFKHPRYKIITCFNSTQHTFAFPRLVDTSTYSLSDKNIFGIRKKGLGISLDLYIVENISEDIIEQKKMINQVRQLMNQRQFMRKVMKLLSILRLRCSTSSFFPMTILCKIQSKIQGSHSYNGRFAICFAGKISSRIVLDRKMFDNYTTCEFEGYRFLTISDYNKFLVQVFGDWKKLPPVDQRIPYHGGDYYID